MEGYGTISLERNEREVVSFGVKYIHWYIQTPIRHTGEEVYLIIQIYLKVIKVQYKANGGSVSVYQDIESKLKYNYI